MYTLADYGRMMADRTRTDAYLAALRASIRPGDVVVDLGAGTGIMTLFACRLGARRVHAIEENPLIAIARQACAANGFSDRVVFHEARSGEVDIGERADIVVSDLRGALPLHGRHVEVVADARARFLRPGGTFIPLRDVLNVALVSCPAMWERTVRPWERDDFDLGSGRARIVDALYARAVESSEEVLLSAEATWSSLEYAEPPRDVHSGRVKLVVEQAGTAHALLLWFDAELAPGIAFSNRPGTNLVYGRTVAPLREPVEVARGDTVDVNLFARRTEDDYVWGWTTSFSRSNRPDVSLQGTSLGDTFELAHQRDDRPFQLGPLAEVARRALERQHVGETITQVIDRVVAEAAEIGITIARGDAARVIRRLATFLA